MNSRSRTMLAGLAVSCLLVTGCGADGDSAGSAAGEGKGSEAATSATPTPATPTYRVLGKEALSGALIDIQDLPPGYSQDPPSGDSTNKTFCDYRPPFTERTKVSRDFTKGSGLSGEVLSVGIRQYANTQEARAAFAALSDALQTCTGESFEGTKYTYAAMSVAKVGDASLGVKISADDAAALQNFALAGPVLINVGGGGLVNASADDITSVLKAQVTAYQSAAGQ